MAKLHTDREEVIEVTECDSDDGLEIRVNNSRHVIVLTHGEVLDLIEILEGWQF